MNLSLPFNSVFLTTFLFTLVAVVGSAYLGFSLLQILRREGLKKKLSPEKTADYEPEQAVNVLLEDPDSTRRKSALARLRPFARLQTRIESAGLDWTVESFLLFIVIGIIGGMLVGFLFPFLVVRGFTMLVLAGAGGFVPFFIIEFRRGKRMKAFEEQLPEALDFIARAIRAGHAFSVSLEMLSAESPDPIKTEFRQVFNEVNLGSSLDAALLGLARRVPLIDTRFFVSAVLLQRETGGNLSEVLSKLAFTIRERFRLKGHIKALTAHGRITASVLTALPIFLTVMLSVTKPDYLKILVEDPLGRMLAMASIIAQILAYIIIRRMINIEV